MKKIYIIIAGLALSVGCFAQTADSLLRRQMELERDFNPTLLDANKINSLPALHKPSVQKAGTNYSTRAERSNPPLEIILPRPGDIMTPIPYSLKKGYLSFNAGNYTNMDGAFGYRLLENEKNSLTFSFLHNSSNGNIKYAQEGDTDASKAYLMDNQGGFNYSHRADRLSFNIGLSYLHSLFNYYGNLFNNPSLYEGENQRLGVLDAKIGIVSDTSDDLNYRGHINFRNFSTAFGESLDSEGIKGTELNTMAGIYKPFSNARGKMGIDGALFSTFYNGDLSNYLLINSSPYIFFGNSGTHAQLGADVLFLLSDDTKIRVVPHVKLQWAVTEHSSLYANIHGGFKNNTFLEMMQESRYIQPYSNVRPAYSVIDADAGVKIGEISGFRFDIFGGFRKTDDEHFLILNEQDATEGDVPGTPGEVLRPIYGNLSHAHIGGMIQSNIQAPLNISLQLKKNFYDPAHISINKTQIDNPRAYNKPGFEADLRGQFNLTDYLKLTVNYYFAGDRWSYHENANKEMDNINDLNAGALYWINNAFSINLRVNNLLNRKYDIWYGYPAQGLNASGGFTFRF